MSSKSDTDSAASSSTTWSVVVEVSAGILRLPVARIDSREVLLDSTIRLQIGQRYELIDMYLFPLTNVKMDYAILLFYLWIIWTQI